MPNELKLTGFDALAADLTRFPEQGRTEARGILGAAAERAKALIQAAYPVVTGALRDGVTVIDRVGRGVAAVKTLRSGSAHAHLYEYGTVHARPHPTFFPVAGRERRAATDEVVAWVERQGITVGGGRD